MFLSNGILVHDFVMSRHSRVEYCNAVLAGAPKSITNKLQRVLNAAARVVSGTRKYDRGLTTLIHAELHWLDVPDRVIQARLVDAPVSARHGSKISRRLLHAVSDVVVAARRTTTPAHHTRPSGLRCYGSHGLELSVRRPPSSTEH